VEEKRLERGLVETGETLRVQKKKKIEPRALAEGPLDQDSVFASLPLLERGQTLQRVDLEKETNESNFPRATKEKVKKDRSRL